jgi:hypothetical protein
MVVKPRLIISGDSAMQGGIPTLENVCLSQMLDFLWNMIHQVTHPVGTGHSRDVDVTINQTTASSETYHRLLTGRYICHGGPHGQSSRTASTGQMG